MATRSPNVPAAASPSPRAFKLSVELEAELREAVADIDRGDYLALTPEQLREWAEKGELRVLDEWLAGSHG